MFRAKCGKKIMLLSKTGKYQIHTLNDLTISWRLYIGLYVVQYNSMVKFTFPQNYKIPGSQLKKDDKKLIITMTYL
jgi:hypothetical protein